MTDEREALARAVFGQLKEKPGQTPTELAKALGETRQRIVGALIYMDALGLMVSEDGHGRLYPFEEVGYGG